MTFHATIVGYLLYSTSEGLEAALRSLRTGGWLDRDDRWQTDRVALSSELGSESTIDEKRRLLVIPPGVYQDLARITTDLFPGTVDGKIVISSTDLCFDGWIERPLDSAASMAAVDPSAVSDITCFGLEAYATSRGFGLRKMGEEGYFAWQNRVEQAFHAEHDPDVELLLSSVR